MDEWRKEATAEATSNASCQQSASIYPALIHGLSRAYPALNYEGWRDVRREW